MNYIFIHLVFGITGAAASASLAAAPLIWVARHVGTRVGTVEPFAIAGRTPRGFTSEFVLRTHLR
jgi:hypothetical protein